MWGGCNWVGISASQACVDIQSKKFPLPPFPTPAVCLVFFISPDRSRLESPLPLWSEVKAYFPYSVLRFEGLSLGTSVIPGYQSPPLLPLEIEEISCPYWLLAKLHPLCLLSADKNRSFRYFKWWKTLNRSDTNTPKAASKGPFKVYFKAAAGKMAPLKLLWLFVCFLLFFCLFRFSKNLT